MHRGSLVYDARNKLCDIAVKEGFDRVLWFDSDMVFKPDLMKRLCEHLDNGVSMVTGVCVTRKNPISPVIYSDIGMRQDPGEQWPTPYRTPIAEIPEEPFEIAGCGFWRRPQFLPPSDRGRREDPL